MVSSSAAWISTLPSQQQNIHKIFYWKENIMFPEFRDVISELKHNNIHSIQLFEKHNALDHLFSNMETHIIPSTHEEIERLKKEKLLPKDRMYSKLKMVSAK
jgi:uncharacterized protein